MNTSQEELQRKEFRDILFELASNQNLLDDKVTRAKMYKRMEKLYHPSTDEKPFRLLFGYFFRINHDTKNSRKGRCQCIGPKPGHDT